MTRRSGCEGHRHVKRITNPMPGFKSFASAKATIAGVELHHMLKKGQMVDANSMPVWKQFYSLAVQQKCVGNKG